MQRTRTKTTPFLAFPVQAARTLTVECVWNVMAHAQKPGFFFRRNGRVHLNGRGRQFSRLLALEVCASAVVMLETPYSEVVWRVLATHSIRQFPLHFSSPASPCTITFQLDCNTQCSCTAGFNLLNFSSSIRTALFVWMVVTQYSDIFTLLCCYSAFVGICLPTLRGSQSIPSSRALSQITHFSGICNSVLKRKAQYFENLIHLKIETFVATCKYDHERSAYVKCVNILD
jgi:hypothetical protein